MCIKDLYRQGRTVFSFEVFPPKKDVDIESIYGILEEMSALAPDYISVTCGAGGAGGTRTTEIASFISDKKQVEPMAHITCVGASAEQITERLDTYHADGIANVLALRGDLPESEARDGCYNYAYELIQKIRERGDFCIGAACYPEGHIDCASVEADTEHLYIKQEAGADFLVTQLCFDNELIYRFFDRARKRGVTIPVSIGIMPIIGRCQIERMVFMCGVTLPAEITKLLHRYENDADGLTAAGVEFAANQIEGLLRHGVDGVHIYTLNKPEVAQICMNRSVS